MKTGSSLPAAISALLLCVYVAQAGIGESAVITLVFPPGARATGLGETFIAIADDANATFFNPAGLGQSPLTHSWKMSNLPRKDLRLTSITAKRRSDFGRREKIWAGSDKGLFRYNGSNWESYETYVIENDQQLSSIVSKFITIEDEETLLGATWTLKEANAIEMKRFAAIESLLRKNLPDSLGTTKNALAFQLSRQLLTLEESERSETRVYGLIATHVDTTRADSLAAAIQSAYTIEDTRFEDLVELKVPFNIAVRDSITALTIDNSDRIWIATPHGLWNYDGTVWNQYTILDGLPSNTITAITCSGTDILAGTDRGAAMLTGGKWEIFSTANGLPDSIVTGVVLDKNNNPYVATRNGLAVKKDSAWVVYDTSNGLLSNEITALFYDSRNNVWIGGNNGVTIFTQTSWKRYKFPDSRVNGFAEARFGEIWIGTTKGAITYKSGKSRTDEQGRRTETAPTWKVFHSKNGLKGNNVIDVSVNGKDVWLITEEGVNHYDKADQQYMFFYEPLLPAFNIPDLWHIYLSGVIPTEDWGTLGFYANYLNFGLNTWTDELGRERGSARSWEGVLALCYGLPIKQDFSLGINIKFINSALAPGYDNSGAGVGRSFAVDAALLKRNLLTPRLDLGFQFQNMGPSIFYISRDESDPIPFRAMLGLSYTVFKTAVHDLKIAADIDREIVKNYADGNPDPFWKAFYTDLMKMDDSVEVSAHALRLKAQEELQEVIAHVGIEYWYVNFIALRTGYMHDKAGSRRELSFGIGLRYGNLGVDWSYIHSPGEMSIARHGQWRLSMQTRI